MLQGLESIIAHVITTRGQGDIFAMNPKQYTATRTRYQHLSKRSMYVRVPGPQQSTNEYRSCASSRDESGQQPNGLSSTSDGLKEHDEIPHIGERDCVPTKINPQNDSSTILLLLLVVCERSACDVYQSGEQSALGMPVVFTSQNRF